MSVTFAVCMTCGFIFVLCFLWSIVEQLNKMIMVMMETGRILREINTSLNNDSGVIPDMSRHLKNTDRKLSEIYTQMDIYLTGIYDTLSGTYSTLRRIEENDKKLDETEKKVADTARYEDSKQ